MKEEAKYFSDFIDRSSRGFHESKIFISENGCFPSELRVHDSYDIHEIIRLYKKKIPASMKKYEQYHKFILDGTHIHSGLIPISKDVLISVFSLVGELYDEDTLSEDAAKAINIGKMEIYYSPKSEARVLKFLKDIEHLKKEKEKEKSCSIIAHNSNEGYFLKKFNVMVSKFDMELNYGSELINKDKILKERLSDKSGSGIALLHGKAGAGKTNYIRHLISYLSGINKRAIYVPPSLVPHLSEPEFVSFMMRYQNSVLLIEDAESIDASRESNMNSGGVHNHLNMADGLLGEAMGVQIICTFNTKINKIDSALKRKGRIIIEHEFKELSIENSQKLSDSLGHKTIIEKQMTLAEIYNQDEMDFSDKEREMVGFKK